ncbi:MAG: peptidase S8 and S53 subtilisin kexin sedolisin, partial [Thermaceae bacterium]
AQPFSNGFPSLVFPAPWNTGSLTIEQNPHPSVSGLSRPADNDLRAYLIILSLNGLSHTTVLSKGWLGSFNRYDVPDLSSPSLLGYTIPSSSSIGILTVTALLSNKGVLQDDPAVLVAAGDYLRGAGVITIYTVGGNPITLP